MGWGKNFHLLRGPHYFVTTIALYLLVKLKKYSLKSFERLPKLFFKVKFKKDLVLRWTKINMCFVLCFVCLFVCLQNALLLLIISTRTQTYTYFIKFGLFKHINGFSKIKIWLHIIYYIIRFTKGETPDLLNAQMLIECVTGTVRCLNTDIYKPSCSLPSRGSNT